MDDKKWGQQTSWIANNNNMEEKRLQSLSFFMPYSELDIAKSACVCVSGDWILDQIALNDGEIGMQIWDQFYDRQKQKRFSRSKSPSDWTEMRNLLAGILCIKVKRCTSPDDKLASKQLPMTHKWLEHTPHVLDPVSRGSSIFECWRGSRGGCAALNRLPSNSCTRTSD